jgi:hypothetical protein
MDGVLPRIVQSINGIQRIAMAVENWELVGDVFTRLTGMFWIAAAPTPAG